MRCNVSLESMAHLEEGGDNQVTTMARICHVRCNVSLESIAHLEGICGGDMWRGDKQVTMAQICHVRCSVSQERMAHLGCPG